MSERAVDPTEPQDPASCTHPGAHVYAHAGRAPRDHEDPSGRPAVAWQLDPHSGRRPGEQLSAALGECGACGSLVVSVQTWHPDDVYGEHVTSYQSRWVGMYPDGTLLEGAPADAGESALPAERATVGHPAGPSVP